MPVKRSIIDYLAEHARRTPQRAVLHHADRQVSFGELEERTARARGALAALGIKAGDRVALVMSDGPEMVIAMLAGVGEGAVGGACSTLLKTIGVHFVFHGCGAEHLFIPPGDPGKSAG